MERRPIRKLDEGTKKRRRNNKKTNGSTGRKEEREREREKIFFKDFFVKKKWRDNDTIWSSMVWRERPKCRILKLKINSFFVGQWNNYCRSVGSYRWLIRSTVFWLFYFLSSFVLWSYSYRVLPVSIGCWFDLMIFLLAAQVLWSFQWIIWSNRSASWWVLDWKNKLPSLADGYFLFGCLGRYCRFQSILMIFFKVFLFWQVMAWWHGHRMGKKYLKKIVFFPFWRRRRGGGFIIVER